MPFDNLDNIVWRSFVGSDDEQKYLVQTDGKKCVNWLAYVNELIYRLPLKETGNNCTKFAILCEYTATKDQIYQNGQYFLSLDNENWEEIELENAEFETLSFVIPQDLLQSENLYFKFTPIGGEAHIGGFALIR